MGSRSLHWLEPRLTSPGIEASYLAAVARVLSPAAQHSARPEGPKICQPRVKEASPRATGTLGSAPLSWLRGLKGRRTGRACPASTRNRRGRSGFTRTYPIGQNAPVSPAVESHIFPRRQAFRAVENHNFPRTTTHSTARRALRHRQMSLPAGELGSRPARIGRLSGRTRPCRAAGAVPGERGGLAGREPREGIDTQGSGRSWTRSLHPGLASGRPALRASGPDPYRWFSPELGMDLLRWRIRPPEPASATAWACSPFSPCDAAAGGGRRGGLSWRSRRARRACRSRRGKWWRGG